MTKNLLEHGLTVGYVPDKKQLVVTVTNTMMKRMKDDGWTVHHDKDIGHFVMITLAGGVPDGD